MDQNRLFLAIAISVAIMLGFQLLLPHPKVVPHPAAVNHAPNETTLNHAPTPAPLGTPGAPPAATSAASAAAAAALRNVPRLKIAAPRVEGSMSLVGARLDYLVLRDYHETINRNSPLVQLLEPLGEAKPYYVQYGWSAGPGNATKLPDNDTRWTASGATLSPGVPVTLSWDNGAGVIFQIVLSVDDDYMFTAKQEVVNKSGAPVAVYPWARIRRDYTPVTIGYYLLHEGPLGVVKGTLQEMTYSATKDAAKKHDGLAYQGSDIGGWGGITDKYWMTALIPQQTSPVTIAYRHLTQDGGDRYQVDFVHDHAEAVAPGATAATTTRVFAGAKVVKIIDHYGAEYNIPGFWRAVDFGWFWFLTRPIFFALDWLNSVLGNFGLAILVFTVCVKLLFFPLANKSYKSMSKMKLLGPKVKALRERYKDDSAKQQSEMMALYRAEKVNPAAGCLPMIIQIPVFFALYKDIFVTIEMRHAPFFGWIRDLSAIDPTNIFTLFGLIPWDPTAISPLLHLGALPLIMGFTMWGQQKLNPPPPDPMQARLFQFMPVIFTFMLARFPAGLVLYWTWNNLLTIVQQWLIMRSTRLEAKKPRIGRTAGEHG